MRMKFLTSPKYLGHLPENMLPLPCLGMAQIASFASGLGVDVAVDDLDLRVCCVRENLRTFTRLRYCVSEKEIYDYVSGMNKSREVTALADFLLMLLGPIDFALAGFSVTDRASLSQAILLSFELKRRGISTIFGGSSVSECDRALICSAADELFIGRDPENRLAGYLHDKFGIPLPKERHPGIPKEMPYYRDYPFSLYAELSPPEPYKYPYYNPGKIFMIPYKWSWGCPHKCSFCGNSTNDSRRIVFKDAGRVISELRQLREEHGLAYFFMLNEYCHISRKYSTELFSRMKSLGITWCGACRCDLEPELVRPMYESGMRFMGFGLESASKKVLSDMKKQIEPEHFSRVLDECSRQGVWTSVYVIVGFPTEEEDDFRMTFDFLNSNIEKIDSAYSCIFYLHPSDVLLNPENYGIRIRDKLKNERSNTGADMGYDMFSGQSWEELRQINRRRDYQLKKLMYLHKGMPDNFSRSNLFFIMHRLSKPSGKQEVINELKWYYENVYLRETAEICLDRSSRPPEAMKSMLKNADISEDGKGKIKNVVIKCSDSGKRQSVIELVKKLRSAGITPVLETGGDFIAPEDYCRKLFDAGLRKIRLFFLGHYEELHDRLAKLKGSFEMSIRAARLWKGMHGNVEAVTEICSENRSSLYELTRLMYEIENPHVY